MREREFPFLHADLPQLELTSLRKSPSERRQEYERNRHQRRTANRQRRRTESRALGDRFHEISYYGDFGLNEELEEMGSVVDNLWRFSQHSRDLFEKLKSITIAELKKKLNDNRGWQLLTALTIQYQMYHGQHEEYAEFTWNSNVSVSITSDTQIEQWVNDQIERCITAIEELVNGGSNWMFSKILNLNIKVQKAPRSRGGSYIATPEGLKDRRATLNIKNVDDERCFEYCLAAFLFQEEIKNSNNKDTSNPRLYSKYLDLLKLPKTVKYPVEIDRISRYETLNDVKINIFEYDKRDCSGKPFPLYNTMHRHAKVCNMLLIRNETGMYHFLLITNFNTLMSEKGKTKHKKHWCTQCLSASYYSEKELERHLELCMNYEAAHTVLPEEGNNKIKFEHDGRKFKHPYFVVIDFESTLEVCEEQESNTNTRKAQRHIPNSCGIKYNCMHEEHSEPLKIINNENPEHLLEEVIVYLEYLAKKSYNLTKLYQFHKLFTQSDRLKYNVATKCSNCGTSFTEENKKAWHHDHISGKYISALCTDCNLKMQYQRFLPVYAHNLKSYDAHFIVPALTKYGYSEVEYRNITCIPNNEEKFISFSKHLKVDEYTAKTGETKEVIFELRFLDTFAFMATSLDSLVKNLHDGCNDINELRQRFPHTSKHYHDNDEHFKMMIQKGIYPYEYITSYDVLLQKELPERKEFYNKLALKECNKDDYDKAKNVYDTFKCQTFLEYHNLYLAADVLLLSDVWENFMTVCKNIYELDPCYYYTAPSLSWDAFLYHSNQEWMKKEKKNFELELLTDIDMYQLFETSIRGGLCQVSKRYAKVNNKYMKKYG
jgi:hypothetical protein